MTKLAFGPTGVAVQSVISDDHAAVVEAATELEDLGYATIWLNDLGLIAEVVRATRTVPVASGIVSVDAVPADQLARTYAELEAAHPGRFVVGIGGAHGPRPLATLGAYLDRLDADEPRVPVDVRVLSALGPRMLALARERTSGAFPVLVTPDYTAQARAALGTDTSLLVQQFVVLEPDAERARTIVRNGPLGFLGQLPQYAASFRRMGFTDDDIAGLSDRLVDGLVAWGDADAIARRVDEQRQAGADQVALSVVGGDPDRGLPLAAWRRLADALT